MKALKGTYNGEKILLEGNVELPKDSKLIVILLDEDASDWQNLSAQSLSKAYSEDEPKYSLSEVKEPNPDYKSR